MAKITWKIWLLLFFIVAAFISIFSIPPTFLEKGVIISSVAQDSVLFEQGLREGMTIQSINSQEILDLDSYTQVVNSLSDNEKLILQTDQIEIINLGTKPLKEDVIVEDIPSTRLKTGLDIQGGARALISAEEKLTDSQLDDLIAVSQERLNVYGLSDVQIRKVSDLSGNKFMLVEIAGSSPQDLEELIAKQGKFEAKIGNETVFVGGNEDITYVGRTGQDAIISNCFTSQDTEVCQFKFVIYLSEAAAQRHSEITSQLSVNATSGGKYLDKPIDFFLDGKLTNSLNIGADLKGNAATQIQISGSETGVTRQEAIDNAELEMKKLQTVLITGSLPFKLKIEQLDRISPRLGDDFTNKILYAGIFAILSVFIVVLIRYRRLKTSLALVAVSLSEVLIVLGVAALIKWNLDLPSIAGIIAAIGTGIDSQIVIIDESRVKGESIKQQIKKALFIIVTAFTTTFVALIPLTGALSFMGIGAVSAGLLKGFAVTTLIGITVGVLITRPAFADIAKSLGEN